MKKFSHSWPRFWSHNITWCPIAGHECVGPWERDRFVTCSPSCRANSIGGTHSWENCCLSLLCSWARLSFHNDENKKTSAIWNIVLKVGSIRHQLFGEKLTCSFFRFHWHRKRVDMSRGSTGRKQNTATLGSVAWRNPSALSFSLAPLKEPGFVLPSHETYWNRNYTFF